MFNALKYSKELEQAGFSREQAEAAINVFFRFMEHGFATKDYLKIFATKDDLFVFKNELRADLSVIRDELKADFATKSDLELGLVGIRNEMTTSLLSLENRMILKFGILLSAAISLLTAVLKLT